MSIDKEIVKHIIITYGKKNEFVNTIQTTSREQALVYIPKKVVKELRLKKGDLVQVRLSKLTVKEEGPT